jgi:hypothetical protein
MVAKWPSDSSTVLSRASIPCHQRYGRGESWWGGRQGKSVHQTLPERIPAYVGVVMTYLLESINATKLQKKSKEMIDNS